jgi:hypothetical protein
MNVIVPARRPGVGLRGRHSKGARSRGVGVRGPQALFRALIAGGLRGLRCRSLLRRRLASLIEIHRSRLPRFGSGAVAPALFERMTASCLTFSIGVLPRLRPSAPPSSCRRRAVGLRSPLTRYARGFAYGILPILTPDIVSTRRFNRRPSRSPCLLAAWCLLCRVAASCRKLRRLRVVAAVTS